MSVPEAHASNVVLAEVHCRRCGYNLYGLVVDGQCPECGLDVWQTILHTVDPAASRLPKLANPRAVGDGLLWVVVCLSLIACILALRPLAMWLGSMDSRSLQTIGGWVPERLALMIPAIALLGLVGVRRIAPREPGEGKPVRRDLWLVTFGLLGALGSWALAFLDEDGWARDVAALLLTIPGVMILVGLGGLLNAIGQRSRVYRMARGARQGTLGMIGALGGVALGRIFALVGVLIASDGHGLSIGSGVIEISRAFDVAGVVVTAISSLMLLIGLAYLLVNSWWIRQAIRRPPPPLGQVVGPNPEA